MNSSKVKALQELLATANKLAIVMHLNPDGDAMGSALALCQHAKSLEIDTSVVSPTPISEYLDWMPQREHIFCFDETLEKDQQFLKTFDTVIFVDHSSTGRCGSVTDYLTIPVARRAYIDHHPSPDFEVAIAISETESAATCCILYEVLCALEGTITPKIATCLYTGIVTDTGNFRYGKNISQVLRIASELVLLGINKEAITEAIYHTNSENRLRLLGFVLQEKMQRIGKHATYITLTQDEIERLGANYNDTEDFVNYPLTMSDVYISAIFIEKEDYIKLSLRSRGEFDVNLLARDHFNGGGHKNASGGRFYGTLQEAVDLYSKNII